jgi:hypothetical protein
VDDVFRVEVVDARYELGKQLGGILLLEVTVGEDVVEELAA